MVYFYNNFPNRETQKFQIVVPDDSVELYKNTSLWQNYEIVGISSVNKEQLVTYYVDDEIYYVTRIEGGAPIVPLVEPHRDHCIFSGWFPIPDVMPEDASVNIYGEFLQIEYRLQYVSDGKIVIEQFCEIDQEMPPAVAPEKDGCHFVKWIRDDGVEGTIMPQHDVILTALYEKNGYSLKCFLDGVLFVDEKKSYDEHLIIPTPEKLHYSFSGWSEQITTMPNHDVILHGTMIPNKYQISYMVRGKVYITQQIPYGSKIVPIQINGARGHWEGLPEYMVGEDIVVNFKF